MIVVFKNTAKPEEKLLLKDNLEQRGYSIHVSDGTNASIFGIIGNTSSLSTEELYKFPFVERVMRVQEPFLGAFHPERGVIEWEKLSIAIVGMGLMGGSYAKVFRKLGVGQIIGINRSPEALLEAQRLEIVDVAMREPGPVLKMADVVILCIYPEDMPAYVEKMLPFLKKKCIITDIAGIKTNMIEQIQAMLPEGMEFISGHPMAGRQASGIGMSDAAIFHNANYIIVPSEKNTPEVVCWLETLARNIGCRHTVRVSPEEHDRTIAYTSNLTHITAVAIMDSLSYNEKTKFFVAGSFKDGTRVADINPELWCNLFMKNREKVADEVDRYIEQLQIWQKALREGDAETMKERMRVAAARRRELY